VIALTYYYANYTKKETKKTNKENMNLFYTIKLGGTATNLSGL